jgi:VIT1/CCC1 family predicted Fe2+/Mn2+ transporter
VPDEEQEELALIYEAKGLPRVEAEQVAGRLIADEGSALDAMVREELGLDPSTLGGSPYSAAGFSFALFAVGALVPLIPYFFIGGTAAVVIAIVIAAAALFVIGALITLLTGRSAVFSGSRQLVFGLLAAGVTFGLGRLIGTVVGP